MNNLTIDRGWLLNLYELNKTGNVVCKTTEIIVLSYILNCYKNLEGTYLYPKNFEVEISYYDIAKNLGLSKRSAKTSINYLIKKDLLERYFRTVITEEGGLQNNVMFLNLNFNELALITLDKKLLVVDGYRKKRVFKTEINERGF